MTVTIRLNILRSIAILIFIAAGALLVHPTFAQDTTSPTITMREKIASKTAVLKTRLDGFKDKRKAQVADRINTNLNRINQNQTDQMKKHLERMSSLLDKLEARVNNGSPDVKDPTAAKTAIADARDKIASVIIAVDAQAEKDYTITVNSEARVKANAQTMRDQLRADLQAVRKQVVDAKQSVSNAIRTAKSGSAMKEGTPSGQQ